MANRMDSKSWTENQLTSRLGLQYPIIQGPLGGLSSQRLTATVSNYGGLGSFGAHGLKPEAIRKIIRDIKGLTAKPFAMNLWVSMEDEGAFTSTEEAFHRSVAPLAKHIESVSGTMPSYRPYEPIRFEDQVQVLLDEGISAFSFIYGIPSRQILDEFRRQGIVLIGTATTVDEAIALEQAGVDVVAASGFESGAIAALFCNRPKIPLRARWRWCRKLLMPSESRSSLQAELEMRAESWQPSLLERKACRWELRFSHVRSQERTYIIARLSSVAKQNRPPLLVGSPEDLPAASRTACSKNLTGRTQKSGLTHFNVASCGN
jgi:hypothetical protein